MNRTMLIAIRLVLLPGLVLGWSLSGISSLQQRTTKLSVASQDVDNVPYVVARGDGSTGGGGVPMPHSSVGEEDGLTRPKVGAPMPDG